MKSPPGGHQWGQRFCDDSGRLDQPGGNLQWFCFEFARTLYGTTKCIESQKFIGYTIDQLVLTSFNLKLSQPENKFSSNSSI
jgi:hypothetical protein